MNELALFAGAGGSVLASRLLGHRVVGAVELDPYCREVLLRRQAEGLVDLFPLWDDIRTFDGRAWRGAVDLVSAGFPCQPFSLAGKRKGNEDERNLWPETARILGEIRPALAFLENVPGLLTHPYFGRILADLHELGFDAEWCVLSAAECGAPHLRRRLWILAYARCGGADRLQQIAIGWRGKAANFSNDGAHLCANSDAQRSQRISELDRNEIWESWPSWRHVGGQQMDCWFPQAVAFAARMDDGVADRLERVRALGNAWVPVVAARAFRILASRVLG